MFKMKTLESLEDVCTVFLIPDVNCTCDNKDISAALGTKFTFCSPSVPPPTEFVYSQDIARTLAIATIIASLIGILGNSLVLVVAWKGRFTLIRYQKLLVGLAICDLVFAVFQMILTPYFWTQKWHYGQVLCKTFRSGVDLGAFIGVGFIVIISVERHSGISNPMFNSKKLIIILTCFNIIFGMINAIPLLVFYDVNEHDRCLPEWPSKEGQLGYLWYTLIVLNLLPISVVTVLYINIIRIVRKGLLDATIQVSMEPKLLVRRLKETKRIMKIVAALLLAFICFVFPHSVISLYFLLRENIDDKTYEALSIVGLISHPFHVAINPVLYSVFDSRWRNEIKLLFKVKSTSRPSVVGSPFTMRTQEMPRRTGTNCSVTQDDAGLIS